jgi:WD40 repeat protein/tetratricopeptide (TPR) repeat protein
MTISDSNSYGLAGFRKSIAVFVAVETYGNGIPKLRTPIADANGLAEVLFQHHGFEVEIVSHELATLAALRALLTDLPRRVTTEDRVLFYFAGHGIALESNEGPKGYLLPQDADRTSTERYLPMIELDMALSALPCRHMLVILDCCFAGALRWASTRDLVVRPEELHQERYHWFIQDRAWQAIASAAHNQKALDVAAEQTLGKRDDLDEHSPFAAALIEGLCGAADRAAVGKKGDGVITATELYLYLEEALLPPAGSDRLRQTPLFWPMKKHDKGQFVFLVPGIKDPPELPPAPLLGSESNPWRGLKPYEQNDHELFFGRKKASETLLLRLVGKEAPENPGERFIVVTGPSGIGKSSLVRAGLLPALPKKLKTLVVRPGPAPFASLAAKLREANPLGPPINELTLQTCSESLADWLNAQGQTHEILLVIDQVEELLTMSSSSRPPEKDDSARQEGLMPYLRELVGWLLPTSGLVPSGLNTSSEQEPRSPPCEEADSTFADRSILFLKTLVGWLRKRVEPAQSDAEKRSIEESRSRSAEELLSAADAFTPYLRQLRTWLRPTHETASFDAEKSSAVNAHEGPTSAVLDTYLQLIATALSRVPTLRVVLTVRSEYEPQFTSTSLADRWDRARYLVPPMTQDELRRVIEGPAAIKVMRFEEDALVNRLVNDVVQMPGALPLLSFALSEMYESYLKRNSDDRSLTWADYRALQGGVTGALRVRANEVVDQVDAAHQATARRVLERLVSLETGEFARRRVPRREFDAVEIDENKRIEEILARLDKARLIVTDEIESEPYVEVAHDALILGWDRLLAWVRQDAPLLLASRKLTADAQTWINARKAKSGLLWSDRDRLPAVKDLLSSPFPGLNKIEAGFAQESIDRAKRIQVIWWTTGAALLFLAITAALAAVAAYKQKEQTITNQIRLLVSNGQKAINDGHLNAAWVWFAEALVVESSRHGSEEEHRVRIASVRRRVPHLQSAWHTEHSVEEVRFIGASRGLLAIALQGAVYRYDTSGNAPHRIDAPLFLTKVEVTDSPTPLMLAIKSYNRTSYEYASWDLAKNEKKVLFAKDGTKLYDFASSGQKVLVGLPDSTLQIVDLSGAGSSTQPWKIDDLVLARLSTDGSSLFAASRTKLWRKNAGSNSEQPTLLLEAGFIDRLDVDPYNRWVACTADSTVHIWSIDQATGREATLKPFESVGGRGSIVDVDFNPDGEHILITVEAEGSVLTTLVYRIGEVRPKTTIDHQKAVERFEYNPPAFGAGAATVAGAELVNPFKKFTRFSPDGRYVAALNKIDGFVRVWDWRTTRPLTPPLGRQDRYIKTFAFSADGTSLAIATGDADLSVWSIAITTGDYPPIQHSDRINEVEFTPDGKRVAYSAYNRRADIWDYTKASRQAELTGHTESVDPIAFSPSGKLVATGSFDRTVRVFSAADGAPYSGPLPHRFPLEGLEFFSENLLLTFASTFEGPSEVIVWDVLTGTRLAGPLEVTGRISVAKWGVTGVKIAVGGSDQSAPLLWEWRSNEVRRLQDANKRVEWIQFDDADKTAWTYVDGRIESYDAESGKKISSLTAGTSLKELKAVSREGKSLAVSGANGQGQLIDRKTGLPLTPQMDHDERTFLDKGRFSADGSRLLTVSREKVRVWSAESGSLLAPPFTYDVRVDDAALDSTGRRIAISYYPKRDGSAGSPSVMHVWSLEPDDRPAEILRSEAEANAKYHIDSAGGFVPLGSAEFYRIWGEYAKSSGDERDELSSLQMWHRQQSAQGDDFGRRFHATRIVDIIDKKLSSRPSDLALWAERAAWNIQAGRTDDAIADYSAMLELDLNPDLFVKRAKLKEQRGLALEAIKDYTSALGLEPGDMRVRIARGITLARIGDLNSAVDDLKLAFEIDAPARRNATVGESLQSSYQLAYLALLADRFDVFRSSCRKSVTLLSEFNQNTASTELWNASFLAAWTCVLGGDVGLTMDNWKLLTSNLVEFAKENGTTRGQNARLLLGAVAARGGNPENADSNLQALELKPFAQLFRGIALARLGDKSGAVALAEAARKDLEIWQRQVKDRGEPKATPFATRWPEDVDLASLLMRQLDMLVRN